MRLLVYQDFRTKLIFIINFLFLTIFVFTLFRLILFFSYYSAIFNVLNTIQVLKAFIFGLRFDISIIIIFYALPFTIILLPIKSFKIIKISAFITVLMFSIMIATLFGDFVYFPESKRHINDELLTVWYDKSFIIKYTLINCWHILLFTIAFMISSYLFFINFMKKRYKPVKITIVKNIWITILILLILLLLFRSRISGKPLEISDIYIMVNNTTQANLTLNGVFTSFHVLRKKNVSLKNNYSFNAALINVQKILLSKNEFIIDKEYPLIRQLNYPATVSKPNICIILLESWSPKYIDSLSGTKYGVTLNFDNIVSNGIVFTNAYASGVRSIFGLSATFTGIPLIPGLPHFAYGLELNKVFSIADVFNKLGYYTSFMQSSRRDSYQMCYITKNIFNVQESFGKEDMPNLMNYIGEHHFGYDYDLLMFLGRKALEVNNNKKPFFIFAFTGTTHTPFNITTSAFEKYPRTNDENKYLNTLYYSDFAIGELIRKSKQDGWFENTIFIFLSDHGLNTLQKNDSIKDKFHIPFVIYAPKILKPQKINYTVSQLDLIPTILHLLKINTSFSALGKNALDINTKHFALISEGTDLGLIYNDEYMRHSRKNVLETSVKKESEEYNEMQDIILSLDKVVSELFLYNKWFK